MVAMNNYILAGAALLIVALGIYFGTGTTSDTSAIRLGAVISETGVAASFGEMSRKGIELAVEEINAAGGIDGRLVEVVFEDDQTNPTIALSAFQKLVSVDSVSAVIGSNFDFVTLPLFEAAKGSDVSILTPSSPYYANYYGENEQAFHMMTDLSEIVKTFDEYLRAQEFKQVGILRYRSVFGEVISGTLSSMAAELGKPPIVDETYAEIGNNDFRTQILKLKSAGVDLVFLDMVVNDPEQFMKQAREQGYSPKIITHAGIKQSLATAPDPSQFNGVVVLDWNVSPESFVEKFTNKYGVAPDNSANRAYDAVYVLAEAVAKTTSRAEVSGYLSSHTFTTPNGPLRFGANNEAADMEVVLRRIEGGVLRPL